MKKRILAFVCIMAMTVSAFSGTLVFAQDDSASAVADAEQEPVYTSFTPHNVISENKDSYQGVVADELENGSVRLIFPAVDKSGNIIVPDPSNTLKGYNLTAEGNVYPEFGMGGGGTVLPYGNMENGIIINYNNWSVDSSTNPVKATSGDFQLLYGLKTAESKAGLLGGRLAGDLNNNGRPDSEDAFGIIRSLISPEYQIDEGTEDFLAADVNGSKKVDSEDAACVIKKVVDPSYSFPVGETVGSSVETGPDQSLKNYFVNPDGKALLIDTNVLTDGYASAYKIELSTDGGQTWKTDSFQTQNEHGKKLKKLVYLDTSVELTSTTKKDKTALLKNEDGSLKYVQPGESYTYVEEGKSNAADAATYVEDSYNTYFFIDQRSQTITTTLEPDTEYTVRVSAIDYKNQNNANVVPYRVFETKFKTSPRELTAAFPTVEGGGIYSTGGRGTETTQGDVYIVTSLEDSVSNPQPGTLRYGLKRLDRTDNDATYPRTIVFAVGGTINIDPTASKTNRGWDIGSNTTIMGQTAPGEGITLAGGSVKISGENIIIRYIRGRLGSGYDRDGGTVSGKNVVIDHCTFSWGVDEVLSPKELINSSIQYCIIANGLSVVNKNGVNNSDDEITSGESEAKHGMATITNGYESTFTHNLYANCGTRMPRFEGAFTYNNNKYTNLMQFSNNVVYNWGHNSGYGGDRGAAQVNFTNNYYKAGLNTLEKVKTQFFECDAADPSYATENSSYYISGNVMEGSDEVTNDNTLGFTDLGSCAYQLSAPAELANPYDEESAADAYTHVLESVGASYVRDAIDARLIQEVINGTGIHINDQAEAGGWNTNEWVSELVDTDKDGIPDDAEAKFGTSADKADSTVIITDKASPYYGYTPLEAYCYDLLGEWDTENGYALTKDTSNPVNSIIGIKDSTGSDILNSICTTLYAGDSYTVSFADAQGEKTLYINDEIAANAQDGVGSVELTPEKTGSYYIAVKTTVNGREGISAAVPVSVVNKSNLSENINGVSWQVGGDAAFDGSSIERIDDNGAYEIYIQGSGRIGRTSTSGAYASADDNFYFSGNQVHGDSYIIAKVDNWGMLDYYQKAGIMVRKSLDDPKSEFYMAAFTLLKGEENENRKDISGGSVLARNIMTFVRTADGNSVNSGEMLSIPKKRVGEEDNYGWIKVEKTGNTVTTYASLDGENWYTLNSYTCNLGDDYYIGFAVDGAQDTAEKTNVNKALFTEVKYGLPTE